MERVTGMDRNWWRMSLARTPKWAGSKRCDPPARAVSGAEGTLGASVRHLPDARGTRVRSAQRAYPTPRARTPISAG